MGANLVNQVNTKRSPDTASQHSDSSDVTRRFTRQEREEAKARRASLKNLMLEIAGSQSSFATLSGPDRTIRHGSHPFPSEPEFVSDPGVSELRLRSAPLPLRYQESPRASVWGWEPAMQFQQVLPRGAASALPVGPLSAPACPAHPLINPIVCSTESALEAVYWQSNSQPANLILTLTGAVVTNLSGRSR